MRYSAVLLAFLLHSCFSVEQLEVAAIRIEKIDQHPTFPDHNRKLVTVDKSHRVIDALVLYPDSGNAWESFLFDSISRYSLIDCNGQWFSIDKATGRLKNEGWKWNEKLPDTRLGRFSMPHEGSSYVYSSETDFNEDSVYKYKDQGIMERIKKGR